MSNGFEEFWSGIPEKALQPTRVKMLEALLRIGKPLSAIQLVDVLDGDVTMWEAAQHLSSLEALGVVEPVEKATDEEKPREDGFDVPYRVDEQDAGDDG